MTRSRTSQSTKSRPALKPAARPVNPDRPATQPSQIELISGEEPEAGRLVTGSQVDDQARWQHKTRPNHHERMQSLLVKAVVGILALVLAAGAVRWLITPTVDLSGYTQFVVTPVIVLLTGILGFFFGKNSRHGVHSGQ